MHFRKRRLNGEGRTSSSQSLRKRRITNEKLKCAIHLGLNKKNASRFRSDLFDTLKKVSEGQPHIVTHSGGEPVVLISQSEFDALIDEREFLRDVSIGVSELDAGKGVSHAKAIKKFDKMKKRWK